jgi:aspartyl-tRNA(Asn)/glutamyl-tRNA(Gln) amidotransferase subunit C
MEINPTMIEDLAHLSRLRLSEEGKAVMLEDIRKMIRFVEQLQEVDVTGVEPLLHMGEVSNVLREDRVEGSVSREAALRNAPENNGVFFRVAKVIKQ